MAAQFVLTKLQRIDHQEFLNCQMFAGALVPESSVFTGDTVIATSRFVHFSVWYFMETQK